MQPMLSGGWDAESVFRHLRCTDRTEIPGSFMFFSILQVRPEEPWPCSLTSVRDLQDFFFFLRTSLLLSLSFLPALLYPARKVEHVASCGKDQTSAPACAHRQEGVLSTTISMCGS